MVAQSAPLVPASLANGEIQGILGLNTLSPLTPERGASRAGRVAPRTSPQPRADGLTPCAGAQAAASPGYYTLDQLGAAYGIGSLLGNGQDGRGETVGLYELAPHSTCDVATYETCFGLANPVSTIAIDGGGTPSGSGTGEADLDIEQVATQAPGASVISYEGASTGSGPYDVWNTIVSADAAQVVSTSWGLCEPGAAAIGDIPAFTTLFRQAAAHGQTVLAAAGDSGSEGCYQANQSTTAQVDYPASDAWVTAVGGTSLYGPNNEVAWNYCQSNESTSCASSWGGQAAGGGGLSRYEPRPSYQPNILYWPVAQSCGQYCREVPDLSANAGVGMVVDVNGAWVAAWGTSLAAPFMAGLIADKNDGCTAPTGVFTPALYALWSEGVYGTALNDITQGNTDMTGSAGGAYRATSGYDAATGLGSPIAAGLSCPEVSSVGPGYGGQTVTVTGRGLERATIDFGGSAAQVLSANATSATVVVPAGSGTVTVSATSILGSGTRTSAFTYTPPPPAPLHGYWLVGGDGGIFTFGSAQFHGSTGNLVLQRPVVGITPTSDRGGYWLAASDGGIFAFGDSGFYGSIPGLGIEPAGTPGPVRKLSAPIVGMVPSSDGRGYFVVGSDGGVFAFGDARFAGSCPAIGGCAGSAVAVMPDATGAGYWLVTTAGYVYAFGDAAYYGGPGPQSVPVTSAVRTPEGRGYWILFSNGAVGGYGDAASMGGPIGIVGGPDPASTVFATSDGGGYWVASTAGAVYPYGNAPYDGGMASQRLNAPIIAATGW